MTQDMHLFLQKVNSQKLTSERIYSSLCSELAENRPWAMIKKNRIISPSQTSCAQVYLDYTVAKNSLHILMQHLSSDDQQKRDCLKKTAS